MSGNRTFALSAHVPYDEMVADPEGVLGQYAAIGCRYVAIPYLMPEYRPGTPGFADVIRNAAMLGEVANRLGMTLLYHNHDFEFQKIDGKYALEVKLYPEVTGAPEPCGCSGIRNDGRRTD